MSGNHSRSSSVGSSQMRRMSRHHREAERIGVEPAEARIVEIRLKHDARMRMQEFEHRAFGDQPLVVQPPHDLVMDEGGAALVHHLGLLLRIEILRDQADDAHEFALPILQPRRPLFDQIQQILFGEAEFALDLLQPRLRRVRILPVSPAAGYGAPQIVIGRLGMRPPLLGPAPLLGKVRLGAMGVAVDAVILQRMRGVENALDRLGPVPFLAFGDIIAGKAQIVEDAVGIGPLPEQIVVLEEMVMAERGMRHDQRLHRHGILFHDVADARVRIDDDLVGQALQPLAVERLVKGKALAEAPMPIHQRQADRGIGVEHLLGGDDLDLDRIDVEPQFVRSRSARSRRRPGATSRNPNSGR